MRGVKTRTKVATLAVSLAVLGFTTAPASARFSVSPSVIEVARGAGGVSSGTFSVQLGGERGERFRVDVEDVTQSPDGGFQFRRPSGSPFSASSWIVVSPSTFPGAPNRTQIVEYQLRIPRNAEPGDHVASLTVKRLPPAGRGQISTIEALAVRTTVHVRGPVRQAVEIDDLSAPTVASGGPVTVGATLRNTGSVRLDFNRANPGSLSVLDGSHTAAQVKFIGVLYPGQTRSFRLAWQDPPTFGRPRARVTVQVAHGTASRSRSILVLPWRQAVALTLIALAAGLLVVQRRRRRARSSEIARR
jgi:hypothetical protein